MPWALLVAIGTGSFFTINMNERSPDVFSLFLVMVPDEHANNSAYVNGTVSIALNFTVEASAERSSVVQLLAKAAMSRRALNGPTTTSPISCKHSAMKISEVKILMLNTL